MVQIVLKFKRKDIIIPNVSLLLWSPIIITIFLLLKKPVYFILSGISGFITSLFWFIPKKIHNRKIRKIENNYPYLGKSINLQDWVPFVRNLLGAIICIIIGSLIFILNIFNSILDEESLLFILAGFWMLFDAGLKYIVLINRKRDQKDKEFIGEE